MRWFSGILLICSLSGAEPARRQRPAWPRDGIVMAGNWEPEIFLRRKGGASLEDLLRWKDERSAAAAEGLKQAGVTLVITNFHKGFGLQAEAADIEAARRFVEHLHARGIRAGGYIGASMMWETFLAEEPGAKDWRQVDERGAPVLYLDPAQAFRWMACRNHPGYHAFLEKLMRVAVERMKFDLVHFDQMESWTEPDVCRCRYCAAQFREFLRARHPGALLRQRLGFDRLEGVEPPAFGPFVAAQRAEVSNPLMQEWIEFRAASCARRFGEYDAFLERLDPQVALEGNPNLDPSLNKAGRNAVDPARLLRHGDIVWSEEKQSASYTGDGRLLSKIRSYKIARRAGKSLFAYTGGRYGAAESESPSHLRIAEAMAFNGVNLGMVGDVTPEGVRLTQQARRAIAFFHRHKALLRDARPAADVAVLRSFPSIEFHPGKCLPPAVLAEQSLIQARVPFDIVFDADLEDLSRYKALIVAGQDALSDAQAAAVRRFVEAGGGLVATEDAGSVTEWRLRRGRSVFASLFGRDRVVKLERIVPAIAPPPAVFNYQFDGRYWKLPLNHAELIDAVRRAAGGLSADVAGSPSLAIEYARLPEGGALLHLLNYDARRPAKDVDVSLALDGEWEVALESPDGPPAALRVGGRQGRVRFTVPRVDVYTLAILRRAR